MKKFIALLLMLMTLLTAGCAMAEAPFEGVWVSYEAGWIKWLMPSDWLEMEVTEEMMEANLFYGAFAPDGSKTLQILWTSLSQPQTIEDIVKQLTPSYDNVELLDVNGKKMVYFADTLNNIIVLPVASDDLAGGAETGTDEAVLSVAVGSLIEVHEVHVDLVVGDLTVVLGGKVAPGLLQTGKTVYPHFGGGEGVAPCDDTGAAVVKVCLFYYLGDLSVAHCGDFIFKGVGQLGAHLLRHLGGALCNGFQNFFAVEILRAHHEPELVITHTCTPYIFSTAALSTLRPRLYFSRYLSKPATSSASGARVTDFASAKTLSER